MAASISIEKVRVGLVFDDFVQLMIKFGYARIEHIDFMSSVFHAMTGFVKDIYES